MALRYLDNDTRKYRVLAYGDSLTAGMYTGGFYPYAQCLESEEILCDHIGLSGWTASEMVELLLDKNNPSSLSAALEKAAHHHQYDLVLIMAGTNDLGSYTEKKIIENVWKLHKFAHSIDIPTLAIGIPGSLAQLVYPQFRERAQAVNRQLATQCMQEAYSSYIDCPVPFTRENKAGHWSLDGLHMAQAGYEALGKALQPIVLSRLNHSRVFQKEGLPS